MKIDCTIDGKTLTLSLNSDKPLSLILRENTGDDVFSYRIQNLYHLFMGDGPVFETLFLEEIKDAKRRQQEASF